MSKETRIDHLPEEEVQAEEIPQSEMNGLPSRKELLLMISASAGLDFLMTSIEMPWIFATFGGSVVIEEIIEYALSNYISKYGIKGKLSWSDKAIGIIPIPGFTAVGSRCIKELIRGRFKESQKAQNNIETVEI